MAPGLYPWTELWQWRAGQLFFQLDAERTHYLQQKATPQSRYGVLSDTPAQRAQHKALDWIRGTFTNEYPMLEQPDRSTSLVQQWMVVREQVQCDIAVLSAPPNDQIITTQIAFPSGWAPERIAPIFGTFTGLCRPNSPGVEELSACHVHERTICALRVDCLATGYWIIIR